VVNASNKEADQGHGGVGKHWPVQLGMAASVASAVGPSALASPPPSALQGLGIEHAAGSRRPTLASGSLKQWQGSLSPQA
jgi:hypothetical protein